MTTQMTYDEYTWCASEISSIEYLLQGIPDERAVERIGLESRLRRLRSRIEGVPLPPRNQNLEVFLEGEPVHGSHGVDTNFGAQAIATVSDHIRIDTAAMTGELEYTGQIPRNSLSQPIITDVVRGSFGFELKIPTPSGGPHIVNYPEEAIYRLQRLLREAKEGDDESLSDAAAAIHPRGINKVVELLDLMKKKNARFAMNYRGDQVGFHSDAEIDTAYSRLAPSNNEDRIDNIIGRFIGVLPETRTFQLDPNEGDPIHGKLAPHILDAYAISTQHTNRQVRARIRTVQIGRAAPKHTLVSITSMRNLNR